MVSVHRYVDGKWIDLPPVSAHRLPLSREVAVGRLLSNQGRGAPTQLR